MSSHPTSLPKTRRSFLQSGAAFGAWMAAGAPWNHAFAAAPALTVGSRTIEVNKKAAKVYSVLGADGSDQPPPSDPTLMLVHGRPLRQTERGRRSAVKARRRPRDEAGHEHFGCRWSIAE